MIIFLLFYMGTKLDLSVREGNRLRTVENGVVRKIFCCKMEKVTGGRIQLHKEERHICVLHYLLVR